jgi:hypothetical protein
MHPVSLQQPSSYEGSLYPYKTPSIKLGMMSGMLEAWTFVSVSSRSAYMRNENFASRASSARESYPVGTSRRLDTRRPDSFSNGISVLPVAFIRGATKGYDPQRDSADLVEPSHSTILIVYRHNKIKTSQMRLETHDHTLFWYRLVLFIVRTWRRRVESQCREIPRCAITDAGTPSLSSTQKAVLDVSSARSEVSRDEGRQDDCSGQSRLREENSHWLLGTRGGSHTLSPLTIRFRSALSSWTDAPSGEGRICVSTGGDTLLRLFSSSTTTIDTSRNRQSLFSWRKYLGILNSPRHKW